MNYLAITLAATTITLIHIMLVRRAYKEGIRDGSVHVMAELNENYGLEFTITPTTIKVNNMKGDK